MPVRQYTLFTALSESFKARFIVDGEGAARYIKSTNSKNTNTPIVAVSAYSSTDPNETSNVFAAALAKPLQKADLIGKFRL